MANSTWKNAVIYQIYPLSFCDSDGDGYGDLKGIIKKLDYLKGSSDSLDVDAIWLSPIYKTEFKDWGYDVVNHCAIDPRFGNMSDFEKLIDEVHKRGIKIILDYIPNHTSDKHSWFLESKKSKTNPKRDWYIWEDPKPDGSPPNNWLSSFGGSAWNLDEKTGQYYLHSFLPEQPDLNWRNPEVEKAMLGVLKFWLQKGVDGFRVDALSHLMKDKNFRDEPKNPKYKKDKDNPYNAFIHKYTLGIDELDGKVKKICRLIDKYDSKLLLGEMHGLGAREIAKNQKLCPREKFIPFNFNFIHLPWKAQAYKKFIDDYERKLGGLTPNWVLGNHDQHRVASRIGEKQARVAAMLAMTLGGMNVVYYGEELGMEDTEIPKSKVKDPWEKRVPGKKLGRDPERTPMQWGCGKNAGFTKGTPWLPVNQNHEIANVESELNQETSMLNFYKKLIKLRKTSRALQNGKYIPLKTSNKNVLAFARKSGNETIYVVLNFSEKPAKHSIGKNDVKVKRILSTYVDNVGGEKYLQNIELRGNEGLILIQDTN